MEYKVEDTELTSIANAIRSACNLSEELEFPTDFIAKIATLDSAYIGKDTKPYLYRKSPTSIGANYNSAEIDKLIGGTVAWNQLVQNGNFADTSRWGTGRCTISIANNKCTLTSNNSSAQFMEISNGISMRGGHKFLIQYGYDMSANPMVARVSLKKKGANVYDIYGSTTNQKGINSFVISAPYDYELILINFFKGEVLTNETAVVENVQVTDLTQAFGTEIADYVYSLEQTTAGSGIAWLKSHGFLTKDYYAYNTGSLLSVKTSEHRTVEFNQWDEEWESGYYNTYASGLDGSKASSSFYSRCKNLIPILPNTSYCLLKPSTTADGFIGFYDINGNYLDSSRSVASSNTLVFTTPSNAYKMSYYIKGSIEGSCVNISKVTGTPKNGDYVPYEVHSYSLDSDLELRGIPKLSNGSLYYDGDVYESSGNVSRKYGIVDLGTLNWGYVSSQARFYAELNAMKPAALSSVSNAVATKYVTVSWNTYQGGSVDKCFAGGNASGNVVYIGIKDSPYTDAQTFKTAMSGVYLVYELATPTTEQADPYANPQLVNPLGTEEYVDTRDVPVPVGHETRYHYRREVV